jgi:hypothetical protein
MQSRGPSPTSQFPSLTFPAADELRSAGAIQRPRIAERTRRVATPPCARWDFLPFHQERVRTATRRRRHAGRLKAWGGKADEVCDRCYHEACDTIKKVNRDLLNHCMRALAGTVAHFATSTDELC